MENNLLLERLLLTLSVIQRDGKPIKQKQIAEDLGYSREGTVSEIVNGKRVISPKFIKAFCARYAISEHWLLTGEGQMFNNPLPSIEAAEPAQPYNQHSDIMLPHGPGIPFTSGENQMEDLGNGLYRLHTLLVDQKSAAGYLTGWGDNEYLGELKHHTVNVRNPVKGVYRSFQVNANNESMHDPNLDFPNGIAPLDIVTGRLLQRSLWRSQLHFKQFKYWTIIHKYEGVTTKQIVDHKVESGIIMCHSLNPDKARFPDFPLFLDDIIQLFNVVKVEKETNY